jgi:hypothetical protein
MRGEMTALTDLRDLQFDLTGARVPAPRPIAIAMRRAVLVPALAVLGADQLGHFELHQLRGDRLDRLAD